MMFMSLPVEVKPPKHRAPFIMAITQQTYNSKSLVFAKEVIVKCKSEHSWSNPNFISISSIFIIKPHYEILAILSLLFFLVFQNL